MTENANTPIPAGLRAEFQLGEEVRVHTNNRQLSDWEGVRLWVAGVTVEVRTYLPPRLNYWLSENWPPKSNGDLTDGWHEGTFSRVASLPPQSAEGGMREALETVVAWHDSRQKAMSYLAEKSVVDGVGSLKRIYDARADEHREAAEYFRALASPATESGVNVIVKPDTRIETPDGPLYATNVDGVIVHGGAPLTEESHAAASEVVAAARRYMAANPSPHPDAGKSEGETSMALCEDCPPVGYPTDITRCTPCPRRAALSSTGE